MSKTVWAILGTIAMGYLGIVIGAILQVEGYLGSVFAIATMGGFLLDAIENKNKPKDEEE